MYGLPSVSNLYSKWSNPYMYRDPYSIVACSFMLTVDIKIWHWTVTFGITQKKSSRTVSNLLLKHSTVINQLHTLQWQEKEWDGALITSWGGHTVHIMEHLVMVAGKANLTCLQLHSNRWNPCMALLKELLHVSLHCFLIKSKNLLGECGVTCRNTLLQQRLALPKQ